MDLLRSPKSLFSLWCLGTLFVAHFHEPWTDEAQAWLVATSSSSLSDLLLRSSIEASGPLFYLLIWPFARAMPLDFPQAIFWVSWLGTALFAWRFAHTEWLPVRYRWLALFGFILGYEYPCVARLYGWGCFLLWSGFCADRQNRKSAGLWLGLACLVQVTFVIAVLGWCAGQILDRKRIPTAYWLVAIFLVVAVGHATLGADYRDWHWVHWGSEMSFLGGLGTTVAAPFIQGPHLGPLGLLVLVAVLPSMAARQRSALLLALAAFVFVFVFRYSGSAQARHGGAVFLLWLAVTACQSAPRANRSEALVVGLLVVNLLSGWIAQGLDVIYVFSDGLSAAEAISDRSRALSKAPRLYVERGVDGYVIAARLGIPVWHRGEPGGCPFFALPCVPISLSSDPAPSLTSGLENCSKDFLCVFATRAASAPPLESQNQAASTFAWRTLYTPKGRTLREPVHVFELAPSGHQ